MINPKEIQNNSMTVIRTRPPKDSLHKKFACDPHMKPMFSCLLYS